MVLAGRHFGRRLCHRQERPFRAERAAGRRLRLQSVDAGLQKSERTFSLSGDVELPLFVLEEDPTQLDEVTVAGDKRDIVISNAGSTTYFLSEHARQSRTSYEALAEVPKLMINPMERTISLNNGESPLILIDGVKRPKYLDVLNPEWIESVEIVEVPSARYLGDESVTCILNIHLNRKKVTPYVNGNAYAQHSVASKFGVIAASVETGNAKSSLYLNLQTFYFADDVSDNYTESVSGDIKRTDTSKQVYNSNSYFAGLGGDHTFSDKSYLAFSARYVANPWDVENNGQGYAEYLSDGRRSDLVENAQTDKTYHWPVLTCTIGRLLPLNIRWRLPETIHTVLPRLWENGMR